MTTLFYNTVQLTAPELLAQETKAKCQEELVLETYTIMNAPMTPFDVAKFIEVKFQKIFPITSIRRAITNLTQQGKLRKSGSYRKGQYGLKNNTWRLNN